MKHHQIAALASALAEQVVDGVGTSSPQRTHELQRALVQVITQHLQRAAAEQVAINRTAAQVRAAAS